MDSYTLRTRRWLDRRFQRSDADGVYFAHQPIYGFRKGHSESGAIERYIRTYQIMKALSHLSFSTFLDVGGAEGYKAHAVRRLFSAKVTSCDLSSEACDRAREIFRINSVPADIHRLPFKDNAFDVVLSSETIEHVEDFHKAVKELLRVSRKALIITVPHEDPSVIEQNIRKKLPHTHIHAFDQDSFGYLARENCVVLRKRLINPTLRILGYLLEGMPLEHNSQMQYPGWAIRLFNIWSPLARFLFPPSIIASLIRLDEYISDRSSRHNALLFIILKDKSAWRAKPNRKVSVEEMMGIKVQLYHLKKHRTAS